MTAMPKPYCLKDAALRPIRRFEGTEDIWFWFMRTEKARRDGAKQPVWDPLALRPCDPDDVYRCVSGLYQDGMLYPLHLEILGEYGFLDRAPYADYDEEVIDWIIWMDALSALEPVFRAKDLIE